jgi:hypothetical protein
VTRRARAASANKSGASVTARTSGAATGPAKKGEGAARTGKSRRTPAETVALAARIKADRPDVTEAELAAALGISASRWRTVRREAAQSEDLRLAA